MATTKFTTVSEYIAAQPRDLRAVLRRVRSAIRKALPGSKEGISYQIPSVTLRGLRVMAYAGWKQHYSIYPATARLVAAFKRELAPYEISKGTIRFPLSKAVPVGLIGRLAKFLVKEAARRASLK